MALPIENLEDARPKLKAVHRAITGYYQDDEGDWVAELLCGHDQHVRHRPPFGEQSWVQSAVGRCERLRSPFECPLRDRAEIPANLRIVRTSPEWNEAFLPASVDLTGSATAPGAESRSTRGALSFRWQVSRSCNTDSSEETSRRSHPRWTTRYGRLAVSGSTWTFWPQIETTVHTPGRPWIKVVIRLAGLVWCARSAEPSSTAPSIAQVVPEPGSPDAHRAPAVKCPRGDRRGNRPVGPNE